MHGTHSAPLVALSVFIAICASYTALTLAGQVAVARGQARLAWLLGGSVAMGSGIWSMHFVAMLAFHLPVAIAYDVPLVAVSYLAAVGASAFALFVASRPTVGTPRRLAAGVCLGLAVVAMHYTGMAAVRVHAHLSYRQPLVIASVVVAIAASTVALWLFLWLRNDHTRRGSALRLIAAVVMGLAIAGMHYTAMAAAQFSLPFDALPGNERFLIGTKGLAVPVVMGAFVILSLTLIGSIADRWVRSKLAAAEALRESEERYRSVVNQIDEVIFQTDAAGRWTFLNPAWKHISGTRPEQVLGTGIHESIHPDDRGTVLHQYESFREGRSDFGRFEVRCSAKENDACWVEVDVRASRDPRGGFIGSAGVIRDVTDRRRADEALRHAREVELASRAKSEFLSRMSHELRTPLNAILGFGQLIELDANTPGLRESGDQILKAGRHLLALINEALDITRIESGRLHMSREPVCVDDVVREVVELVRPLAAPNNITLSTDAADADRYVHADRQRLKQVLLNLIANAVKYNRAGGQVCVTFTRVRSGWLRILVRDTGGGIAAEKLSRLFTPFDRLGAEQLGVEGTGLGLALSRRLAEAMGGSIGVESEIDVGTTFWVELGDAKNPLSDRALLTLASEAHAEPTHKRPTRRILYVEDNLSNLTLVQRILARDHHIELIPAMQGGVALELARLHRPDLVLLDLHLPDVSGEQVLRQLRDAADCRAIPVVILSADATAAQIDRLLAAGAHAYVTKPLAVQTFLDTINGAMDVGRAA